MKRTARKYSPASPAQNLLITLAGIVVWALLLAPVVWFIGVLASGNLTLPAENEKTRPPLGRAGVNNSKKG